MKEIEVIDFALTPSILNRYVRELRDVEIQGDQMRFRANLSRIGELMAYEISKRLDYKEEVVTTPLATAICREPAEKVVLATILRAGLPLHDGFLKIFDHAENAFVSAYRKYHKDSDEFDVLVEYMASPSIEGKVLIIIDPMLATGSSMELAYKALLLRGMPSHIHVASAIASQEGVEYVLNHFPKDKTTLWCAAIDPELNPHRYIVPGLGDAGDLAYGHKV